MVDGKTERKNAGRLQGALYWRVVRGMTEAKSRRFHNEPKRQPILCIVSQADHQRDRIATTRGGRSMIKLKELWQYAVFRWCVYVTPLVVFVLCLKGEVFASGNYRYPYDLWEIPLEDWSLLIWFLILTLPAVWVWRKPFWRVIGFLNKKAD